MKEQLEIQSEKLSDKATIKNLDTFLSGYLGELDPSNTSGLCLEYDLVVRRHFIDLAPKDPLPPKSKHRLFLFDWSSPYDPEVFQRMVDEIKNLSKEKLMFKVKLSVSSEPSLQWNNYREQIKDMTKGIEQYFEIEYI